MDFILSESRLLVDAAHTWFWGSVIFLIKSSHHCGTHIRPSAQLCSDFAKVMSIINPYSSTKLVSVPSHDLISITYHFSCKGVCVLFVYTGWVGKEMQDCCFPHQYHVTPFSTASSSSKFMCCTFFTFCNQLTPYIATPSCSSETQVTRELASTRTSNSGPSTHNLLHTGSYWCTLAIISSIIMINRTLFTLLSQSSMTATLLFMNTAATLSHLTKEKYPNSFPYSENMAHQVRMCDIHGTLFSFQHVALPPNFQAMY